METCDRAKNYNAKEFLTSWNNEDYIGNGNFASVRRCYHPELGAVVVKAFSVTGNKDRKKKITEEFYDETKVLDLIVHKNIVRVFGTAKWSKFLGIVMEYIDGGALQDLLLDEDIKGIPWELRLRFMLEITQALVYLHYGDKRVVYIHSDLKSQNILFTRDLTIKLADFGSANIVTATRATRIPTTTGSKNRRHSSQYTAYYAAPEVLKNTDQKRTRAMDVYSSSMICYEVITRSEVFLGPNSSVITSLIMSQGQKPDKKLLKEVQDQLTDDVDQHIFKVLNGFMVKGWSFEPANRPDLRDVEKSLKEEFDAIDQAAFEKKIKTLKDYVGKNAALLEESKRVELSKFQDDLEETEFQQTETETPPESPKLQSQDLNVAFNNGVSIAVADPYNLPPVVPERDQDMETEIPSDENGLQPYVNDEVTLAELSNNFEEYEELETSSLTSPELYQTPEEELSDKQIVECSRYVTLFDYEAATEYEISLKKAEVVLVLERNRGDYWKVYSIEQRKSGLVDARMLIPQAWYFGNSAVDKCERRLLNAHTFNGNFMITDLEEGGSKLRLSVMHSSKPFHYEIEFPRGDSTCRLWSDSGHFSSLVKLIENYQEVDEKLCCRLTTPYSRRRKVKHLSFAHDDIFLERKLRFGLVSEVWRGLLHETLPVLVKVAENTAVTPDKLDIMQRIAHDNVVRFYGSTSAAPFYVTTEYTRRGNLLEHFSSESNTFDLCDGIEMGYQISNGMAYIERMNYIHGNLRASNILVGEKNICKIAGFGFYHLQNAATFPNKWSSPETFETRLLTPKSDVWSFGILLTEIFTKGREPYPGMKVNQVIEELKTGYRMPKEQVELESVPLPEDLYELLLQCWEDDRTKRPTFHYVREFLQGHPLRTSDYETYSRGLLSRDKQYSSRKGAKEHLQDYQTPQHPSTSPTSKQPKIPNKSSPMYIAILPHNTNVKDELSVKKGDIFYFHEKWEETWYRVYNSSGVEGFVPVSCIIPLEWYAGLMGETECEELMKEHSGTFMIRESAFDEGVSFSGNTFHLSVLSNCAVHYTIEHTKFHTFNIEQYSREFTNLTDLVEFCTWRPRPESSYDEENVYEDIASYTSWPPPESSYDEDEYVMPHATSNSYDCHAATSYASRLSDVLPFFGTIKRCLYTSMELDRSELVLQQKVESSKMATVCKGLLRQSGKQVLSYNVNNIDMKPETLQQTAVNLQKIDHEHIAKYFGNVHFGGSYTIITEYLHCGNLQDFFKSSVGLKSSFNEQLTMATQVSSGMAYLEANKIVHGDLRDVNVLVGQNLCKVSGLGVADFHNNTERLYHFTKWTAPEVKAKKRVTHKSDVWSYGVLLYVIFSKGKELYSDIKSDKIRKNVRNGYRMPKPSTTTPFPDSIYDQMKLCWNKVEKDRPDFKHIKGFFDGYYVPMPSGY